MNGFTNGVSHTNGDSQQTSPTNHINGNGVGVGQNGDSQETAPDNINGNGHIPSSIPVAICGMAMRLPGGIRDDEALYEFLVNKGDARSVTPSDRYNVEAYYNPDGKPGTVITKHGYYLNDVDFSQFDHSMFTLAAAEAELMDPSQRLILEVVREALERAGENWREKPIGTYVGMFTEDWQELHHKDSNFYHPYLMMGTLDFALANRISYEYDLRGPR